MGKIVTSLLGVTVFFSGVSQLPLNAQMITSQSETLIAQPSEAVTIEAANARLTQKAIALLDALKAENFEEVQKMAAPDLKSRLSTESIAQLWGNLTDKTGEIQKYESARVINTLNADVVIVETEFAKTTNYVVVTYNKKGEIIGVNVPGLESVEKISQDLVISLSNQDYNSARRNLHPFLKEELFASQIQEKWASVIERNGSVKAIKDITVLPGFGRENGQLVAVTVEFEQTTDEILIIFDENQLITGVDMAIE